jgi:tellurite resistance protein TerC
LFFVSVPTWVWTVTLVGLIGVLALDLSLVVRRPREPRLRESATWVAIYVGLAVAFGFVIFLWQGAGYAGEFLAGWLTEYSLSVDNLFVFVVIMAQFRTPRQYQQKALMIGIVLALLMRGAFIGLGAAALSHFDWVFYLFGFFLVYTAIRLLRPAEQAEFAEHRLLRWARAVLPVSSKYDGARLTIHRRGRRHFTPMLVVMVALGTTDLVFALDSIPAIFGLTKVAYLVFTANVFALMGLRQLYFLLGGLLARLVYLSRGLAAVLLFIGVKLVLEALRENELPFINDGDPIPWIPSIPIWLSLTVIIGILAVATVASLTRHTPARPEPPVRYGAASGKPEIAGSDRRSERAGSGRPADGGRPDGPCRPGISGTGVRSADRR